MSFYDKLETRSPKARESALFKKLVPLLCEAVKSAPALAKQLDGINISALTSRKALAQVPVVRKSDLLKMQAENPPFAGLTATSAGALKRLLVSPGPIFDPEGYASDWWGAARALYAAGFRKGDIAINCFSYHLTPGGHIMESGAHALGCATIPAGIGNTEQQLEAIHYLQPNAYCGTPDFLKILLDKGAEAGSKVGSIKKAMVSGAAFPPSLQAEISARGIDAYQSYATADLGIIAYESAARAGLIVNEGIIVEIVRPGTNEPMLEGEVGEIVVTRLNPDYPLLRFGTGDLSKFLSGQSSCGRTGQRLAGWMGRADQTAKVKGMFVHPSQIADVGKKHPELGRLRLIVSRKDEQDTMLLKAETEKASSALSAAIAESLRAVTKLRGEVDLVAVGSLPNDGKIISDERS